MKDRLFTVFLSVATTIGFLKSWDASQVPRELEIDRLIVRKELIVSDTGKPWEEGYEAHQIPRGIYAKSLDSGVAGLWVRSRLIKGEIDDPFDDRFHAIERSGKLRQSPGHISWNVWLDGNWRQMAIIQGEGLEDSEVPHDSWNGLIHPGRLRFQSLRPGHNEPLTDALIGQGKMSLGGGGYGGGGLPSSNELLELWGGEIRQHALEAPLSPQVVNDDGSGRRIYQLIAVGAQGARSKPSPAVETKGIATLQWESVAGADSYVIIRDDQEIAEVRIEGSMKSWKDQHPR
jgi:hypothetical protein